MRPWVHVLGVLGGIAATAGFEGWTTSAHGPRSSAHYAAVENASMTPKEVALAFERTASGSEGARTIEHVAADGDIVMVHYRAVDRAGAATAGVDIFRVANHKILEHWSVAQPLAPP